MTALQLAHKLTALENEAEESGMLIGGSIHRCSRKDFDALNVPEVERELYNKPYWRKEIEMNGHRITIFCDEPPVKDDD